MKTALCLFFALADYSFAQTSVSENFSITGFTTAGGGVSGGASAQTLGILGPAVAGYSSSASVSVTTGPITSFFTVPYGDYRLGFSINAISGVTIKWPANAAPYYLLESTPAIGSTADWQPVLPTPQGNTYSIQPSDRTRFFRLHHR
jgi:hypothetical protein